MVLTSGRIKRHRYSFATLAAIRRALFRVSNVRFAPNSGHWSLGLNIHRGLLQLS
jgi:hypothetical protein